MSLKDSSPRLRLVPVIGSAPIYGHDHDDRISWSQKGPWIRGSQSLVEPVDVPVMATAPFASWAVPTSELVSDRRLLVLAERACGISPLAEDIPDQVVGSTAGSCLLYLPDGTLAYPCSGNSLNDVFKWRKAVQLRHPLWENVPSPIGLVASIRYREGRVEFSHPRAIIGSGPAQSAFDCDVVAIDQAVEEAIHELKQLQLRFERMLLSYVSVATANRWAARISGLQD